MFTNDDLAKAMVHTIEVADRASTPFAAILLDKNGKVVLDAVNTSAKDGPLAHAEMNLLHQAVIMKLNLEEMCLVSTCEPCPMCMGAIVWSKISRCAYGVSIEIASKYMNQIHINARDIAAASFTKVKLIEKIHFKKALTLFQKYG